jgi:ankyrin repeat protein
MLDLGYSFKITQLKFVIHSIVQNEHDVNLKQSVIKVLIGKGVKVEQKDRYQLTALEQAVRLNKPKLATSLIRVNANIELLDTSGKSLMHYAAKNDGCNLIKILIKSGLNVDFKDNGGRTPLYDAVNYGSLNAFKLLIKYGAVLSYKKLKVNSVLYQIISKNKEPYLTYYLEKRGDIFETNDRGETMVFLASKFASLDVIKLLQKYDADIDAPNKYHQTPLFIACQNNNYEIVNHLLESGANPDVLWRHHHFYFRKGKLDYNKAVFFVVKTMNICWLRICLENGADVNAKDNTDKLLAEFCIDDLEKLKLLISYNLNLNNTTQSGEKIDELVYLYFKQSDIEDLSKQ